MRGFALVVRPLLNPRLMGVVSGPGRVPNRSSLRARAPQQTQSGVPLWRPPPARIGVLLLLLLLVLLLSSKSVLTNLAKSDQLFSLAPCELVAIKKPKWPHAFLKGSGGVDGQATRL